MLFVPPSIPFMVPEAEADHAEVELIPTIIGSAFGVSTEYTSETSVGTVADTTPPVITLPPELAADMFGIWNGITLSTNGQPAATMNSDGTNATDGYSIETGTLFKRSIYTSSMQGGISFTDNVAIDTPSHIWPSQGNLPDGLSCDNEITWNERHPSWQGFPVGYTTITCIVSDTSGNTATASFTILVVFDGVPESADTTPPPQNHDVIASHGSWANTDIDDIFTPDTLTINVGDTVTWIWDSSHAHTSIRVWGSFVPGTQAGQIGDNYPPYTHTFNQVGLYEYTDWGKGWCQNLSTAFTDPTRCPNGTIIVVDPTPTGDTTPPVVTVPSNISVSTPSSSGITSTFTASASDNVSGSLSTSCNPLSGSLFPIGTTTVTCTAIDNSGNLGNASFTVTVTYSTALPTVVASFDGEDDASSDYFTPNELIVNVGDTVTWLYDPNSTYGYHRIYGEFTGGYHYIGENYPPYEHTFDQPGTYVYTDHVKGWCQNLSDLDPATCPIGTITVVESGAPPPIIQCSGECNLSNYLTTTDITNPNFMQPAIATHDEFPEDVTFDITVVWQINVGVPDPVYYAHSQDGGLTFTESGYIGDFGTAHHPDELWSFFDNSGNNTAQGGLQVIDYSYPSMGNSNNITLQHGGNSYKVWSENICPSSNQCADNSEIFLSKNNSSPINLSNNTSGSVGAVVAVDGNNVYVAWKEYTGGDTKAYAARSTDGGISFEQPIIVDSRGGIGPDYSYQDGNAMNISIVASHGNVYAVWQNNDIIFDKLDFDSSMDRVAPVVTGPNNLLVYGEQGSEQVVTFDVSATDNVGVVSGPTCFQGMTIPIQSGSTITITGSSGHITCSATDAAGNVGYVDFGYSTSDRFDFTLPSECPADIRQWSGGNATPMTVAVNENLVTTSITTDWPGLGDFTSKFVYQINDQTVRVVDVPAHNYDNFPKFMDMSTFPPGEYTVFSCLFNNYTGGIGGNTYDNEPVTRFAESATFVSKTPEIVVPSWIKNNAGWWASDQITDSDFVLGLQWLITNGIMSIPPTEQGAASDNVIPSWIKNNAEWWADGLIDNFAFVTGLQWLITNGIMVIG